MLRHLLIFLPLVGAVLDLLGLLASWWGRLVCFALLSAGLLGLLRQEGVPGWPKLGRSALLSLGGAVVTFLLANNLQLGTVVASALVGLTGAALFDSDGALVVYLGAFVGMSSPLRFPTLLPLAAAGLLGGVLFELLAESWSGVGGRLGTLAATGVLVVLLLGGGGL